MTIDAQDFVTSFDSWIIVSCTVCNDVSDSDLGSFFSATNDTEAKTKRLSLKCHLGEHITEIFLLKIGQNVWI